LPAPVRLRSSPRLVTTLAGAALAVLAAAGSGCGRGEPVPNVLLITVDTLRPDHLGAYGHPRGPSPVVDRLLAGSTAFRSAIVPRGQTWPTLASIQTSLYPVTHGIRKNGQPLAEDALGLAEVLGARGWSCGAFLSNSGTAGWRGFEIVEDQRDRDGLLVARARGWMKARADRPFFLWIHLFTPHRPFTPPPPLDELYDPGYAGPIDGSIEQMRRIAVERRELSAADVAHALALYDGEVRALDGHVADLLAALAEAEIEDRTLVVFTSDHGEELYERNYYFSHSASVYDTVLRVPLAFRWPGRIPEGRWVDGIVEAIDLAPTILDLVGEGAPEAFAGRSLVPAILDGDPLDRGRLAFSELEDRVVSVRSETHRYVHNPDGFAFPLSFEGRETVVPIGRAELYDLRLDPRERVDRSSVDPEAVRRLREAAIRWMIEHDWDEASRRHRQTEIPDDVREQLEAIGYAG
jgi:arylsulfatase A-like enzyme